MSTSGLLRATFTTKHNRITTIFKVSNPSIMKPNKILGMIHIAQKE